MAPIMAASEAYSPTKPGNHTLSTTKASQAPEAVPKVRGETSGFWVNCCIKLPTKPKVAPTMMAITIRGN